MRRDSSQTAVYFLSTTYLCNVPLAQAPESSLWRLGGRLRSVDGLWKCWHLPGMAFPCFPSPLINLNITLKESKWTKILRWAGASSWDTGWRAHGWRSHQLKRWAMMLKPALHLQPASIRYSMWQCFRVAFEIGACQRKEEKERRSFKWQKSKAKSFRSTYCAQYIFQVTKVRKKNANPSSGDTEVKIQLIISKSVEYSHQYLYKGVGWRSWRSQ